MFLENKLAVAGVVISWSSAFCFVGPLIYHTNQVTVDFAQREAAASAPAHPLGTDANGFDVLGRLMARGQSSLEVGIAAAVLATVFGVLWGAVSGYFGGVVDAVMMRVVDVVLSIPVLFLVLVLVVHGHPDRAGADPGHRAGLVAGHRPAGPRRGAVAAGAGVRAGDAGDGRRQSTRAVLRHIVPNAIGTIMVNATFQVADAILIVALSFLGLGIRPPQQDWGGDALQRHQLPLRRLLVADLPGRVMHRAS